MSAEYFARYNLGNDVPFVPYTNGIVSYDTVSDSSRGSVRPSWELLYAHYVTIKRLDAPWTTAFLNHTLDSYGGFELGVGALGETSGSFDGIGWGSLLYRLDESDVASLATTPSATTSASTYAPTIASSTYIPNSHRNKGGKKDGRKSCRTTRVQ